MSNLLLPQGQIPIGFAMIGGRRVPIEVDQQWMRFFSVLTERVGGVVAPANIISYIASSMGAVLSLDDGGGGDGGDGSPGPQGPAGAAGASGPAGPVGGTVMFVAEDPIEPDISFPGLQGLQGPSGATGATGATGAQGAVIYVEADAEDGLQGPPGPAGAQGAAGAAGAAGASGVVMFVAEDPIEPELLLIQGPRGATGSGGGSANSGAVTLDFGAFPGASDASVTVTGQASILAASNVQAWIFPAATTDHTADEHIAETLQVFAGNIVAGTGFTVYGMNASQLNEPVSAPEKNASVVSGGTAIAVKYAQPGAVAYGGGQGTRIFGKWNIGWSWS